LQLLRFPLPRREFDDFLYGHGNLDGDPANQWLRRQLIESAEPMTPNRRRALITVR